MHLIKNILAAALIALLSAVPAMAQNAGVGVVGNPAPTGATQIAGRDASGNLRAPTVDATTGALLTSAGSGTSANQVQGNVASASSDSGNPVKVGAVFASPPPTFTAGQRTNLYTDSRGSLRVSLVDAAGTVATSVATPADATANSFAGVRTIALNTVFDGTNWNLARGDTTGAYVVAKGGGNIATGQAAVTTSATLVAAARTGRQKITLSPTSSVVYYVGATGVTSGTGVYVAAGGSITLDTAAAVYAVGASNVTISYIELY